VCDHSSGSTYPSPSQSPPASCCEAATKDKRPPAIIAFSATVRFVTSAIERTGPFITVIAPAPKTPTRPTAPNSAKKMFPLSPQQGRLWMDGLVTRARLSAIKTLKNPKKPAGRSAPPLMIKAQALKKDKILWESYAAI